MSDPVWFVVFGAEVGSFCSGVGPFFGWAFACSRIWASWLLSLFVWVPLLCCRLRWVWFSMNFLLLVCFLFVFVGVAAVIFVGCFVEVVEVLCVAVVPFVLFTGNGRWWWFDLIVVGS